MQAGGAVERREWRRLWWGAAGYRPLHGSPAAVAAAVGAVLGERHENIGDS